MAERASVFQHIQVGVEATPGTAVAASKQLRSLGIAPSPKATVQQFRPTGQKYIALAVEGEEWVEAALTGAGTYDEIIYPLSSILGAGTVTTTGGASTWVFNPQAFAAENPKTFTVEHGDTVVRADKFSYGIVDELSMTIDRTKFEIGGAMLGQRLTDGITMTASPTFLPLVPIVPSTISVFADTTAATIGTTQLTRLLSIEWHLASKYGPLWTLDATKPSFAAHVDTVPALTATVTMEADTVGMGYLTNLRAGTPMYWRIQATGPVIGAGPATYKFTLDMPVLVIDTQGFSDSNGVYAIQWSLALPYDSTFNSGAGGAMLCTVVNATPAL